MSKLLHPTVCVRAGLKMSETSFYGLQMTVLVSFCSRIMRAAMDCNCADDLEIKNNLSYRSSCAFVFVLYSFFIFSIVFISLYCLSALTLLYYTYTVSNNRNEYITLKNKQTRGACRNFLELILEKQICLGQQCRCSQIIIQVAKVT